MLWENCLKWMKISVMALVRQLTSTSSFMDNQSNETKLFLQIFFEWDRHRTSLFIVHESGLTQCYLIGYPTRKYDYCEELPYHLIAGKVIWVTPWNTENFSFTSDWIEKLVSVQDAPSTPLRNRRIISSRYWVLGCWN